MTFLRAFMLLALVVWVGGIIFFAFVLAPNLFSMLETELAGDVVRRNLAFLHLMGFVSAVVFLICSLLYSRVKIGRLKPFALVNVLVLLMLVFTLISQFRVMPKMDIVRTEIHFMRTDDARPVKYFAGWDVKGQLLPAAEARFDRLHRWSVRLEGGALFLGLVVVVLTARRFS